jgi:beta-phosphoglucomutase
MGVVLTEKDNERLKGVSRMDSLDILLGINSIKKTFAEKEQLASKKNEWFVGYINAMKPEEIFPGVAQMIKEIKKMGIKVALASSSKNAPTVLRLLGIESDFDAIVDGNMIYHSKPDPEIFLLAAKKMMILPSQCLVFEDAEAGVEAALRAGMQCVGVGSPETLRRATLVVKNTADFDLKILKTL